MGLKKFKIKRIIILSHFLIMMIIFCNCGSTNKNQKNAMAYQIVLGKYKEIPTFTFYEEFNDNAYIITLIESDLIVLKEFADTWQDNFKMHLDDFTYVQEYEIQNSRNDIMFYFLSLNQGSAFGIAYFNLYSLKENTVYTITASGPHSAYNKITVPKDIENNRPEIGRAHV